MQEELQAKANELYQYGIKILEALEQNSISKDATINRITKDCQKKDKNYKSMRLQIERILKDYPDDEEE